MNMTDVRNFDRREGREGVADEQQPGQQLGRLKLSEAIRIGRPLVNMEDRRDWTLCAIGCAFAGVHGRKVTLPDLISTDMGGSLVTQKFADRIGFPLEACQMVNRMHQTGMPALEIADSLAAQGL